MTVAELPPKTQKKMVSLYRKAQGGNDQDVAKFAAAMRAAQSKNWPYRALGEAVGISYEMVRIYTTKHPEAQFSEADLGLDIPQRAKPVKVLPLKEVPAVVVDDLKQLLQEAITGSLVSRRDTDVKAEVATFFAALDAAEKAGWDASSVGHAINVHPRAVKKFIGHHQKFGTSTTFNRKYPKAPSEDLMTAWDAKYPTAPAVKIPDDVAAKMRALKEDARPNRGNEIENEGNPALESARNYSALLGEWYLRGASRQELERASEQNWEALRMRLSRWGFMTKPATTPVRRKVKTAASAE